MAGSLFGAQGVPVKSPEVAPEVLEGRLGVELFDLGERDRPSYLSVEPGVVAGLDDGAGAGAAGAVSTGPTSSASPSTWWPVWATCRVRPRAEAASPPRS